MRFLVFCGILWVFVGWVAAGVRCSGPLARVLPAFGLGGLSPARALGVLWWALSSLLFSRRFLPRFLSLSPPCLVAWSASALLVLAWVGRFVGPLSPCLSRARVACGGWCLCRLLVLPCGWALPRPRSLRRPRPLLRLPCGLCGSFRLVGGVGLVARAPRFPCRFCCAVSSLFGGVAVVASSLLSFFRVASSLGVARLSPGPGVVVVVAGASRFCLCRRLVVVAASFGFRCAVVALPGRVVVSCLGGVGRPSFAFVAG